MTDFLDELHTPDRPDIPANAPAAVLAVGIPRANSLAFEAYARMIEAIKALDLPMVFEIDGELDNVSDFPPPIEDVASATAWIAERERPIREAFASILAATQAMGKLP